MSGKRGRRHEHGKIVWCLKWLSNALNKLVNRLQSVLFDASSLVNYFFQFRARDLINCEQTCFI